VLVGTVPLGQATIAIDLPDHPGQGGHKRSVTVLPSGPLPPNPSELVASPRMHRLVEGLGDLFDTVVIDSPPILPVADTLGLAKLVDGVIVVVRAKSATGDEADEVRAMVERLDIPLVGIVVSDVTVRGGYGTYGSYTSHDHERPSPDPAADVDASIERLRAKRRAAGAPEAQARASSDR
jgi:non-specific protein-tyrosine kinase